MLSATDALDIIYNNKSVAIVGLSPKTDRPSYKVGSFLQEKGYTITPVNPGCAEVLGQSCAASLGDLQPGSVDWIDLFVNPVRLMPLVDDIIRLSPKLVWCQIGVVNDEFNQKLDEAGISYIADKCPKIEWNQ